MQVKIKFTLKFEQVPTIWPHTVYFQSPRQTDRRINSWIRTETFIVDLKL